MASLPTSIRRPRLRRLYTVFLRSAAWGFRPRYDVRVNFQDLFAHQAWADASLLSAVHAHPPSQQDEWLQKTLHHIVTVQRFYLSRFLDRPFDREKEGQQPASFADLVQLFRSASEEEIAYAATLTDTELNRRFELPRLNGEFTFADGLTQIVMHSQNHRGQCLRYMRKHGAEPPTLDYILWAKDRPAPAWPQV